MCGYDKIINKTTCLNIRNSINIFDGDSSQCLKSIQKYINNLKAQTTQAPTTQPPTTTGAPQQSTAKTGQQQSRNVKKCS